MIPLIYINKAARISILMSSTLRSCRQIKKYLDIPVWVARDPDAIHGRSYKKYNASETVKRIIIAHELAASGKAVLTGATYLVLRVGLSFFSKYSFPRIVSFGLSPTHPDAPNKDHSQRQQSMHEIMSTL